MIITMMHIAATANPPKTNLSYKTVRIISVDESKLDTYGLLSLLFEDDDGRRYMDRIVIESCEGAQRMLDLIDSIDDHHEVFRFKHKVEFKPKELLGERVLIKVSDSSWRLGYLEYGSKLDQVLEYVYGNKEERDEDEGLPFM